MTSGWTLTNLTPHSFVLYEGDEVVVNLPPSGRLCRIGEQRADPVSVEINGSAAPLIDIVYTDVDDLPTPEPGVLLLVSRVTAQVLSWRDDVVFPLDEVRNNQGQIVGCRALGRFVDKASGGRR